MRYTFAHPGRTLRHALVAAGLVLAATPVLAGSLAPAASASTTRVAVSHANSYCQLLKTYHSDETSAVGKLTSPGQVQAAIKTAYQQLLGVEPRVLSVVPAQLKSSYQTVFGALNTLYAALAKVGFNFLNLGQSAAKTLQSESAQIQAASNKITAYDKSVCHVSI